MHSSMRPTETGRSPSGDALARREHERPGADTAGGLAQRGDDDEAAGPEVLVGRQLDAHRAHEVVPLLAGVLAGGLDELGLQDVVDVVEAGEVTGAEVDDEVVGHDPAALDVDRALVVHLAHDPATELDRADGGTGATEHPLDHTLQAPLQ